MKKLPTFVCRKSENSDLIKCICGRCEADQLRVELAAANAKLSPAGIPYCDNGAIRIAELEARTAKLEKALERLSYACKCDEFGDLCDCSTRMMLSAREALKP